MQGRAGVDDRITVDLFGRPYTFQTDTGIPEANRAAQRLVREVGEVERRHGGPTPDLPRLTIMILAALNMAHQLNQREDEFQAFMEQAGLRCERLRRRLDEGLNRLRDFHRPG